MGNRKKILWEAVKRLIAMILACVGASRLTAIILTVIHWQFMKMYFVRNPSVAALPIVRETWKRFCILPR